MGLDIHFNLGNLLKGLAQRLPIVGKPIGVITAGIDLLSGNYLDAVADLVNSGVILGDDKYDGMRNALLVAMAMNVPDAAQDAAGQLLAGQNPLLAGGPA